MFSARPVTAVFRANGLSSGCCLPRDGEAERGQRPYPTFPEIALVSRLSTHAALTLCLGLLMAFACVPDAHANGQAKRSDPRFDGFIVQFKPDSSPRNNAHARQRALDGPGRALGLSLNPVRRLGIGADLVRSSRKLDFRDAEKLMNRLRRDPDVQYVEMDRVLRPTLVPNDPLYAGNQWHYFEATGGIGLPTTWGLATGSGVVVAVLDTGITNHSDLNGNVVAGYDFIADATTAGDGNGRDADPSDTGDWVTLGQCGPGEAAEDSSWHGTHVAGTIAALTNNAKGVAGVAFNAKVMPLRVLGHCGGLSSDIADAVVWAAGGAIAGLPSNPNPVEVINLSLGGPNACGASSQAAINFAVNAGTVVVVSAGNDGEDALGFEPANCANVITVGATSRAGAKAGFSNYGTAVDVSAPGGSGEDGSFVASTWNTGTQGPLVEGYANMQGTSMSAPHVSGVAALMQGITPSSPAAVEAVIKSTARALPVACPQGPQACGTGIVDALAAVTSVSGGALIVSDVSATEGNAGTRTFVFTISLSRAMAGTVSFNIATANGSATAGSDYVALNLSGQTIFPGATSKSFSVTVNGDTSMEADETFTVNVSNVSGIAVAKAQGVGTIMNDDATALSSGVAVGPISGSTGTNFYYSLVVPPGKTNVTFTTSGGTGDADLFVRRDAMPSRSQSDQSSQGADTQESVSIDSPVAGTYYVLVYAWNNISGVSVKGQYTPGEQPMISVNDVAVTEGNAGTSLATFTVSLSGTSGSPVTFDIATENGTAAGGADYAANAASLSIPAGQTSANFSVSVNGDTVIENNETFVAELRNVSGALVAKPRGQARINNDDLASLSIGDISLSEGDNGASTATFVVRLSKPMPSPVTYNIATSNGSASAGSDYVARSITGRFIDAGRSTQVFEVQVNGDTASEANETFNVAVTGVSGALVADGTAIGTIVNDDAAVAPVVVSFAGGSVSTLDGESKQVAPTECRSAAAMTAARRRGKSVRHCEAALRR
jgi:serine protease